MKTTDGKMQIKGTGKTRKRKIYDLRDGVEIGTDTWTDDGKYIRLGMIAKKREIITKTNPSPTGNN